MNRITRESEGQKTYLFQLSELEMDRILQNGKNAENILKEIIMEMRENRHVDMTDYKSECLLLASHIDKLMKLIKATNNEILCVAMQLIGELYVEKESEL